MSTCEGLLERLGFECQVLSDHTLSVVTPFTFSDGEPIGLYLNESDTAVKVSDNADTLAHFSAIGFDTSDRKKWRRIKATVESFGLQLSESGEIVGNATKALEHRLVMNYISAMLAILNLEREYVGLSDEVEHFISEVEFYLHAWKPGLPLERDPSVTGHSGRLHTFHFAFGDQLVDATRPHGNRTGAILRKAADIINSGNVRPILVIMDDRDDLERVKVETDILTNMVSVLPFTKLVQHSTANLGPQ